MAVTNRVVVSERDDDYEYHGLESDDKLILRWSICVLLAFERNYRRNIYECVVTY